MSETKNNGISLLGFMKEYSANSNIHVGFNTSSLTDIWTGSFIKNKEGVWYLNGGLYPIMALSGGNNTQKTGKVVYDISRVLYRFSKSIIIYADSESTLDLSRLARVIDELYGIENYFTDHIENKRFFYMPASDGNDGTAIHNRVKEIYENMSKAKESKDKELRDSYQDRMIKTPFWSAKTESYLEVPSPIILVCDSISEVSFDRLSFKQFEEGDIDIGGKKRTRDMEIGNLRRVLVEDTCRLGPRIGLCSYWTAQVMDKFSIDGKPVEKDSTFIRQNKKLAAPKAILKLPHLGIEIIKGSVLKNSDGTTLFPSRESGTLMDAKMNPDLVEYSTSIFRNKMGKSGNTVGFIGSQRDGIQEELSMYFILRNHNYFGLVGSAQIHRCALLPEVTIKRTTIYDAIREDKKLARAIAICYQLWFIQNFWGNLPEGFCITPEELYQAIKDQGIDWDELLNTVDFWHDNPEFIKVPTLTIYELLEIAVNKKPIYWKKN